MRRCKIQYNLFIYQARKSSMVPAGFLTAQFLQKPWIYEAFVAVGKLFWVFSALLEWRNGKVQAYLHIPFPPRKECGEAPT